jgi:hypothetical protein
MDLDVKDVRFTNSIIKSFWEVADRTSHCNRGEPQGGSQGARRGGREEELEGRADADTARTGIEPAQGRFD